MTLLRLGRLSLIALFLIVTQGCVTGSEKKTGDDSTVTSLVGRATVYYAGGNPAVTSRPFTTKVTYNQGSQVDSYKFDNQMDDGRKLTSIIAVSHRSAGFGVYDAGGNAIVEFADGKVESRSCALFERKSKEGVVKVRWFLTKTGPFASVIESYNADNQLVHTELTTYTKK